jgi:hypothetical protein
MQGYLRLTRIAGCSHLSGRDTDVDFRSESGRELAVRLFPYWYRDMEQGIFVETAAEDGSGTRGVSTRVWTTALATAMYPTNTQPENVYYANGAYYIAADGSLQGLAADDEPGIQNRCKERR